MSDDLRPLHGAALDDADALVGRVTPADMARPTPCAGWDLAALLAHVVGQHHGVAAAVRAGTAPHEAYAPVPWTPAAWAGSVGLLRAAFAAAAPEATAVLVEIAPGPLPLRRVVGVHLLDTVVHAWDVARSLGLAYSPTAELVTAVAAIAGSVPATGRERPGAAFAHPVAGAGTTWERTLALLGRDPGWGGARPGG